MGNKSKGKLMVIFKEMEVGKRSVLSTAVKTNANSSGFTLKKGRATLSS